MSWFLRFGLGGENAKSLIEAIQGSLGGSEGDLSIDVERRSFHVHSYLVKLRSPVFERMLADDFKERKEKKIEIKDFNQETVGEMVNFLYGFELRESFEDYISLFRIADKYAIEDLKKKSYVS